MSIETRPNGDIELYLSDNPDDFVELAEWTRHQLKAKWKTKLNGLDQSYWDLEIGDVVLTVHREHYLGVSVIGRIGRNDKGTKSILLELENSFKNTKYSRTRRCS